MEIVLFCRLIAEGQSKLEAKVERLRGENEALMNSQRPQVKALEAQIANASKENAKLRHQVKVTKLIFLTSAESSAFFDL